MSFVCVLRCGLYRHYDNCSSYDSKKTQFRSL